MTCRATVGPKPWYLNADQWDALGCACDLPKGHKGVHQCRHNRRGYISVDGDGTLNLGDCDLLPDGKPPFYTVGVHGPPPPPRKKDCPPHVWLPDRDRCMTCDTHRPPPPTMVVVPI